MNFPVLTHYIDKWCILYGAYKESKNWGMQLHPFRVKLRAEQF